MIDKSSLSHILADEHEVGELLFLAVETSVIIDGMALVQSIRKPSSAITTSRSNIPELILCLIPTEKISSKAKCGKGRQEKPRNLDEWLTVVLSICQLPGQINQPE